jgi:hypothetical protein
MGKTTNALGELQSTFIMSNYPETIQVLMKVDVYLVKKIQTMNNLLSLIKLMPFR